MEEPAARRASTILGWLIVVVPAAALLLLIAWITTMRLGSVVGGAFYAISMGLLAAYLLWRWRRD